MLGTKTLLIAFKGFLIILYITSDVSSLQSPQTFIN